MPNPSQPTVDLHDPTQHTFTHAEWLAAMTEQFGPSHRNWAFICPQCGDIATGQDWLDHFKGDQAAASEHLGRECIGRVLGALSKTYASSRAYRDSGGRGCDWCAYGLFRGPLIITIDDKHEVGAFRPAPRVEPATPGEQPTTGGR